jgi:hypothetical protein
VYPNEGCDRLAHFERMLMGKGGKRRTAHLITCIRALVALSNMLGKSGRSCENSSNHGCQLNVRTTVQVTYERAQFKTRPAGGDDGSNNSMHRRQDWDEQIRGVTPLHPTRQEGHNLAEDGALISKSTVTLRRTTCPKRWCDNTSRKCNHIGKVTTGFSHNLSHLIKLV